MNIDPNRGKTYGVHHLLVQKSSSLSSQISEQLGIPTENITNLLKIGAIYLNHRRQLTDVNISVGGYLRVHTQPRRFPMEELRTNMDAKNLVLFENRDFLVANKPSGVPVHPTVDNILENLLHFLITECNSDFYVTHRLDVATSGLIVYAKTKVFQTYFNDLLMNGQVTKKYRCRVEGQFANANPGETMILNQHLIHYMEPSPRAPKKVMRETPDSGASSSDIDCPSGERSPSWQRCELIVKSCHALSDGTSELEIELLTGRTHQIRAQLSFDGFPIVGDQMYGAQSSFVSELKQNHDPIKKEAIALRCSELEFQDILGHKRHFYLK